MSAVNAVVSPSTDETGQTSALLRTLVLCDLVDSTALVERLGDREAAELIRKHDRLARTIADRHGGREIDKTDGFLMMFDRPIQAVGFALDYVRGLRQLNAAESSKLAARVGIHVGDVVVWDNTADDIARGAKPVEVEGLIKPTTSRLMSLALPGQILLSHTAYDLARRSQGELGEQLEKIRWRTHGRYRFQGIPEPVSVFEIGEEGLAPLKAPPWSSKAHREVPFWRRPATVVIEAMIVAALVAIPIFMFLRPDPAIAFASRDWVVVGSLNNLTGESVFDDALESALRIGLEQSRYVNVLPDLKVRDTVKRMERDPDATKIDRAIGSEVAIRDGARALILPTVAEIGGRVRITAEVIDPQTQTTVYSETADGIGAESVLPSLDTINSRLRVRLGEALATVSADAMPLQRVSTKNLDALRAYSLGVKSFARGEFDKASGFFNQALLLDPQFASSNVRIGVINVSKGMAPAAIADFDKALATRDRLSVRDAMYAEVMRGSLKSEKGVLSKWAALAESYPDYFAGSGGYSYMSWREANRFDEATLAMARNSASAKNPTPMPSLHLIGILQLGRGNYEEARAAFSNAEALSVIRTEYHSATFAAERKFKLAYEVLARSPSDGATVNPVVEAARTMLETSYALDSDHLAMAKERIAKARAIAPAGQLTELQYMIAALSIGVAEIPVDEYRKSLEHTVIKIKNARKNIVTAEKDRVDAIALFLAYLAATRDFKDIASELISSVAKPEADGRNMLMYKLHLVASAELQRAAGDAEGAIARLTSAIDNSELFVAHVALLNAYKASRRWDEALKEADWLATHRGRAYAEYNAMNLLTAFNVEQSTLALLYSAECAAANGNAGVARRRIDDLISAWPEMKDRPLLKLRVDQLRSQFLLSGT